MAKFDEAFRGACGQPLAELATQLASVIVDRQYRLIGVTGPSAVGKSSFADQLLKAISATTHSCMMVSADDFLMEKERGSSSYRSAPDTPLAPENYDFKELASVLRTVKAVGQAIRPSYSRQSGWVSRKKYSYADFYIIDGLFLNSGPAVDALPFDLTVVIEAPWSMIAKLRRERDKRIRTQVGDNFRSSEETETEILNTQESYLSYDRKYGSSLLLAVYIDEQFRINKVTS